MDVVKYEVTARHQSNRRRLSFVIITWYVFFIENIAQSSYVRGICYVVREGYTAAAQAVHYGVSIVVLLMYGQRHGWVWAHWIWYLVRGL